MSTEPTNPPEGSSWGDAAPSAEKGWSGRKTAVAVGVAVLIAAGGGVAIAVGTSGTGQPGRGPGGGWNSGGPGGAVGGGAAALRDALHGDFVVADGNGGYLTERLQTGDITEISANSVALTSKDGYKQVYTIDSSTWKSGDPKTGDNVTVVAKVSGTTATATSVGGAEALPRGGRQGAPPNGQDRQGGGR